MVYDARGGTRKDLVDYHIFRADEMPEMQTILFRLMKKRTRLAPKRSLKFLWTA